MAGNVKKEKDCELNSVGKQWVPLKIDSLRIGNAFESGGRTFKAAA